jgi:pyruvate/2-oxoglutarate dehydrogenase complex dihydrolipoamide acyltransferase (E2) component
LEVDTVKVRFSKRVTFEGFTYLPDQEYEVGDRLAARLRHNFARFMPVQVDPKERMDTEERPEINATKGAIDRAAELGIDLRSIQGTGADGRITKADVEEIVTAREAR